MYDMSPKKQLLALLIFLAAVLLLLAGTIIFLNPLGLLDRKKGPEENNSANIPILMYHHFELEEDVYPGTMISGEMFESQIKALSEAGYTAISFEELVDFVFNGASLPKNPLVITIDDGYLSVYDVAFPILKKYDMKATVFIIGVSHGRSFYRNTAHEILPRFNDAQALEMAQSGVISIQSHSYDMHQYELYEDGPFREGVLRMEGESEEEYIAAFNNDFERAASQIEAMVGKRPFVFSYPYGFFSDMTDGLLIDMGVKVTLTIEEGPNIVERNSPDSLLSLNRINVPGNTAPEDLLRILAKAVR